jgi:hypothetical protein
LVRFWCSALAVVETSRLLTQRQTLLRQRVTLPAMRRLRPAMRRLRPATRRRRPVMQRLRPAMRRRTLALRPKVLRTRRLTLLARLPMPRLARLPTQRPALRTRALLRRRTQSSKHRLLDSTELRGVVARAAAPLRFFRAAPRLGLLGAHELE